MANILRQTALQVKVAFRDKIGVVHELRLTANELVSALLRLCETESVCILDSCGVGHLGSHLLIAGIEPVDILEITDEDPTRILDILDQKLGEGLASIFTLSYEFGEKLNRITGRGDIGSPAEPDIFLASFDVLVVHDYDSGITILTGNSGKFLTVERELKDAVSGQHAESMSNSATVRSTFTKAEYLASIEKIKERIRRGDTYQTNLTQQLVAKLSEGLTAANAFLRLRRDHPAPFAAFLKRRDSTVISASPERFFRVTEGGGFSIEAGVTGRENPTGRDGVSKRITTSPIKGTRPRGTTVEEDAALRTDLLACEKDRAENTMIVDLLRNDLGRVCEYGSVRVEKLCEIEEHPTLFHLVSTVSGDLRRETKFSDIVRALYPCGSITGAPKISTMRIINQIETVNRGLSMGAIGYHIPNGHFGLPSVTDLCVAIRTMVVRDNIATFNVGGGIVIDSDPDREYDESLLKAKALLTALEARFESQL